MHFVEPSREVLAETLLAAGPDAATLCTGWLTRDLAAHLYLRERKVGVGLGLLIATSADILVVSRAARLRMPEVTLGITSDVAPLRRYLPDPWIRRMCLLGDIISAEDLHLDNAGAIVCDPGRAEETVTSLLVAMTAIDADFLKRTKRGLCR